MVLVWRLLAGRKEYLQPGCVFGPDPRTAWHLDQERADIVLVLLRAWQSNRYGVEPVASLTASGCPWELTEGGDTPMRA